MITLVEPTSEADLDQVRRLMRAFVEWARERYVEEIEFVERYFDPAVFDAELRRLPGKYARPKGRLLLAFEGDHAAGCVALRDLGAGICEMKRLYVDPRHHGKGVGRALVSAVTDEARRAGYAKMRLDTGPGQVEAQGLYRDSGFRLISPYYDVPEELRTWLVFMEKDLNAPEGSQLSLTGTG